MGPVEVSSDATSTLHHITAVLASHLSFIKCQSDIKLYIRPSNTG